MGNKGTQYLIQQRSIGDSHLSAFWGHAAVGIADALVILLQHNELKTKCG